jgi:hypothetical protein
VHGEQFPGELECIVLEVVAEAEVAEHLEKGVMARGVADVFQVVVLATGADAFLARGGAVVGPLVEAQEHVLELVHAGVGEQQRRVVAGHDRARRDDLISPSKNLRNATIWQPSRRRAPTRVA